MKENYKFKVGDRVQFKTWEEMEDEYGLNELGSIKVRHAFCEKMRGLCGRYATIKEITRDKDVLFEEIPNIWVYSFDMLKPVEVENE